MQSDRNLMCCSLLQMMSKESVQWKIESNNIEDMYTGEGSGVVIAGTMGSWVWFNLVDDDDDEDDDIRLAKSIRSFLFNDVNVWIGDRIPEYHHMWQFICENKRNLFIILLICGLLDEASQSGVFGRDMLVTT